MKKMMVFIFVTMLFVLGDFAFKGIGDTTNITYYVGIDEAHNHSNSCLEIDIRHSRYVGIDVGTNNILNYADIGDTSNFISYVGIGDGANNVLNYV